MRFTIWTYRQSSQNWDTRLLTAPSHQTSTSQQSPLSVSTRWGPLSILLSDLWTTVQSPDDDKGVSLQSELDSGGAVTGNEGWTTVETVLVRFATDLMPSARFPVRFDKPWLESDSGQITRLGYDAAVCVQKYEPWIMETHITSTTSASALQIVGGGSGSTSMSPDGEIRGDPITNATRYLNTTGKNLAFAVARRIGQSQFTKLAAGRDEPYVPSPTVSPAMPHVQRSS